MSMAQGDRQCIGAEIGRVDGGVGETKRTSERDTAAAGADVENTFDSCRLDPRRKLGVDEFRKR